jgi:ATP-dependent exoDNAse (exonuclease V) beta subunit
MTNFLDFTVFITNNPFSQIDMNTIHTLTRHQLQQIATQLGYPPRLSKSQLLQRLLRSIPPYNNNKQYLVSSMVYNKTEDFKYKVLSLPMYSTALPQHVLHGVITGRLHSIYRNTILSPHLFLLQSIKLLTQLHQRNNYHYRTLLHLLYKFINKQPSMYHRSRRDISKLFSRSYRHLLQQTILSKQLSV